jgi:glutamate-5-semialdehyde dehydrogenase
MTQMARQAKAASRELAQLTTAEKNACLLAMALALEQQSAKIKAANALDMETGAKLGLTTAMLDRLRLDDNRIAGMAKGLREVAALPDPVGKVLNERVRPNGLKLKKVTTPIGVVVIIYESRPNVTADAASLCFKSGNATILRGGKEALHSNHAIAQIMVEAGRQALASFPPHAIQVVPTTEREAIRELLSLTQYVDLCMPRGGEGLIRAVAECSKVPVIKHYKGVCHVYIDELGDLDMAEAICFNAKVQRAATCNAMETMLVHKNVAVRFLPRICRRLTESGVELRGCERTRRIFPAAKPATEEDWYAEYLDLVLAIRVVDDLEQAIDHIARYGSSHTDAIVSEDIRRVQQFVRDVDSSSVMVNTSTRFSDGGEYGLGAEVGISTDKLHARGPMGVRDLTTYKWVVYGNGQLRT